MEQFIYLLRLKPELHDENRWTEADHDAVHKHLVHLQNHAASKRVLLAGRTQEDLHSTFGVVLFVAKDPEEANQFMLSDPAIIAGVMTAELRPFKVAISGFSER
jgi:uncharacterized protein YciI